MKFLCGNCEGPIEAPDELGDAEIACPHCGAGIVVPRATPGLIGETPAPEAAVHPEVEPESYHPTTPEEFRARMEAKKARARIVTGILVAAVTVTGIGFFLYFVPPSTIAEYYSKRADEKLRKEIFSSIGIAPTGFYQSESLPGLGGDDPGKSRWKTGEEDKVYLVVDTDILARFFLPTDEGYERIKQDIERKRVTDPTREVPSRDRCRLFDPGKFTLIAEGVNPVRGRLININYGSFNGFYESFQYVTPEPSGGEEAGEDAAEEVNLEQETMKLSVAFVIPAQGINPNELWLQLDEMDPLKVPAEDALGANP